MSRKWQGTALFAAIMAGVSVTIAGRMLAGGGAVADAGSTGTGSSSAESGATGTGSSGTDSSGSGSSGTDSPGTDSSGTGSSGTGSSGSGATTSGNTVTGDVEQTRFGNVQVAVTFDGTKITAVKTLQAPSERGRDEMLTEMATPQLEQEVIASQSARVDTISGATYTSEGYLASVQSAIDAHK